MKRARETGMETSRHTRPPGATPRLNEQERTELAELLPEGAVARRFRGNEWMRESDYSDPRRARGRYHPAHVNRLLKELMSSLQQP